MSLDAKVTGIIKQADGGIILTLQNSRGGDGLLRVENPDRHMDLLLGKQIWGCNRLVRYYGNIIADRHVQAIRLRSEWWKVFNDDGMSIPPEEDDEHEMFFPDGH